MRLLVYVEMQGTQATPDALGLLGHLALAGFDVSGLMCGGPDADLSEFAACGASTCFVSAVPSDDPFPIASRAATIGRLCVDGGFDTVLFTTSAESCDIAARLSGQLDAGIISGLTALTPAEGGAVARRSTLADSVVVDMRWTTPIGIGLFRPACFAVPEPLAQVSPIAEATFVQAPIGVTVESLKPIEREGISLRDADIIVGAGRGVGTQDKLELVRDLATALGGALGVSLPLVDMGWAPRALQVGQTGTIVQPKLYVACGISGQIQHRIGMERSGAIIAINKDRDAPIMGFCDLAVVGDLQKILPALIDDIRNASA